jgi:hypothetical protein
MPGQLPIAAGGLSRLALCALLVAASFCGAGPALAQFAVQQTPVGTVSYAYGPRGMTPFITTGNGTEILLPVTRNGTPAYSRQSGLQLRFEGSSPGQYGYRPVRVTFQGQKAAANDKVITFRFSAGDYSPPRGQAINLEQTFKLPAGSTSVTHRLLVPRYQDWQLATWEVLVDGRKDDFLAIKNMYLGSLGGAQAGMGVMGLDLTAQQVVECNGLFQTAPNALVGGIKTMAAHELPLNWIEYSSLDVFITRPDGLVMLAEQHPKRLEALLRWVRSGGNLWLLEAGEEWENLSRVEKALGVSGDSQEPANPVADETIPPRGWRFIDIGERALEPSQGALLLSGFDRGQKNQWEQLLGSVTSRWRKTPPLARQLVVRGYGLGAVAAFRGKLASGKVGAPPLANPAAVLGLQTGLGNEIDASISELSGAISQSLLGPRIAWTNRHGNQPDSTNEDFNNLLIPGVGVAPVGQFQILVTLFAIVIGPLNYWLLKRSNKLPLLLATVPIAAAITTALLFAYGLLVDGFDVRARARTLTLLDQQSGEAVSWGRLSYYAGIAPREGLAVPSDQLMYPIMPRWMASRWGGRATGPPRHMTWTDQQLLTRGWLASRTPTQYQAVSSRPSQKRIDLRVTDGGLRVVNRLGVDVTHLAVEDHDGKFYWCENLPDGQGQVVPPVERTKLSIGIRQLFTANIPESPAGDEIGYGQVYGFELSQNIMEGRLEAINEPTLQSWGRGKYIAFTKSAVELDLGLRGIEEEASFHVIEGSW